MSQFDAESLRPAIRAILSTADQSAVTARQVRKMLVQNDPSLSEDLLAQHKEELNAITKSVFEALTAASDSDSASASPDSRSPSPPPKPSSHSNGFPRHVVDTKPSLPSPKPVKAKSSSSTKTQAQTDAEYAQSLSLSLNSHSTRNPKQSSRVKASSSSGSGSKRKKVQSSAIIHDGSSDSELDDAPATQKKKQKAKKVKKEESDDEGINGEKKVRGGAFNKEMGLSEPLQALLGEQQLSRPQTVKRIWAYVKERGLQDESDKRFIICDDRLQAVFQVNKVHMFTMNKILSKHFYPLEG